MKKKSWGHWYAIKSIKNWLLGTLSMYTSNNTPYTCSQNTFLLLKVPISNKHTIESGEQKRYHYYFIIIYNLEMSCWLLKVKKKDRH